MKTRLGKGGLKFTTPLVIAGALFLAGCGGSDAPTPPPPVVELSDAQKAVNAASAAVGEITAASAREEVVAAGAKIDTARDEISKLAYAERAQHTTVVDGLADSLDLADRLDAIDKISAANSLAGMDPVNIASLEAAIMAAKAAIANVPDSHQAAYTAQLGGSETALSMAIVARDALDLANRRSSQMSDLTNASEDLQAALTALAGVTPTQALLDTANTALAALNGALERAADLTATETATYRSQAGNAVAPIAMAQGRFNEAEKMRLAKEEQDRIDDVVEGVQMDINSAMEAVDGLTVSSSADDVQDAKDAITTARTSIEDAEIPEANKATLRAALALQEGALKGKETLIANHRNSEGERQRIAGIVKTLEGDVADAKTAVDGLTDSSTNADVMAAEAAIKDAKDAINDAEIPDVNKTTLLTELAKSEGSLVTKVAGINRHRQETATNLYGVIYAPAAVATGTAVGDVHAAYNDAGTPTDSEVDTFISVSTGTGGDSPSVTLVHLSEDKETMVKALKDWDGMKFTHSVTNGDNMGDTYEAFVYSDVGKAEEGQKFGSAADNDDYQYTLDAADNTELTMDDTNADADWEERVASSSFNQSAGIKEFPRGSNELRAMVTGSYHGVAGTYYCAPAANSTCAVRRAADGFDLGGTLDATNVFTAGSSGGIWTFKPNNPEARLVDIPDGDYASYGWWIRKNADGDPVAASAFHDYKGTDEDTVGIANLRGTAKYTGGAAGKYALHSGTGGTNDAGHFTADATLDATFGTDHTITGEIHAIHGADGVLREGWSVKLNKSTVSDTGIIAGDPETSGNTDNQMTVWTINDTAADAAGQWSGTLREQGDDGVPGVATGTFHSTYGSAGNMVGAFGAKEEEE